MKKSTKRYILSLLFSTILLCTTIAQGVFAGNVEIPEIVKKKRELVEYAQSVARNTEFRDEPYEGYLLKKLADIGSGEVKLDDCREELESYGCFILETEEQSDVQPRSIAADVAMSTPTVSYLSQNDTWIVGGGGQWKSTYGEGISFPFPSVGATQNTGGGLMLLEFATTM
ncbi:hypothetical protein [Cuneatibacter caecimuris]|uniref:Uncharacterized protein n=1 Tax=Cuneatibacter caecimuris TaxID=1796618 RepID=A0A4Q7NZH7_9FIRM|nr:hypothetical protein [Cuneatibacter caecimuris]RZS92744.1 hypothetical protein EV209_2812 [Cuneatibacter caecimuris]